MQTLSALGLLVLFYPFLPSMAQKGQNQKSPKTQEQENALQVVRQNIVANNFYDTLQEKEVGWTLNKALYSGGLSTMGENNGKSIYLFLQKNKANAQITIREYNSENDANPFRIQVSQGIVEICKNDECGDEGRKIYRPNGDFSSMEFRKGYFLVSIYCNSEEVAKRFAGYAIDAITNR